MQSQVIEIVPGVCQYVQLPRGQLVRQPQGQLGSSAEHVQGLFPDQAPGTTLRGG
jgi:hypothetical protein